MYDRGGDSNKQVIVDFPDDEVDIYAKDLRMSSSKMGSINQRVSIAPMYRQDDG